MFVLSHFSNSNVVKSRFRKFRGIPSPAFSPAVSLSKRRRMQADHRKPIPKTIAENQGAHGTGQAESCLGVAVSSANVRVESFQ
jgi:hypothetical protein